MAKYYKKKRREDALKQSESDRKEFEVFFSEYDLTLQRCQEKNDIYVIKFPGVEADDLAAYIVDNKYALDINDIWMISSDKDWDMLIEEDVSRFSTVTRTEVTYFNWPYPVSIEQYPEWQTLMGDSDVPGFDMVGPVKAKQLLDQYHSIFDLYECVPLPGKAKWVQSINNGKENLLLFLELMDFRSFHREAIGEHLPELEARLKEIFRR